MVVVITPKVAADISALGGPYWGRLNALNMSARKRTLIRSERTTSLARVRSSAEMSRARKALRPRLPNVPAAGVANAAGLTHACGVDPPAE
jgi:hypothetical protein